MTKKMSVTAIMDGPVKISGFDSLTYCGETLETKGQVFLCRCGQSKNKPFCDGSHNKVGFQSKNDLTELLEERAWIGKTIRTNFNSNLCMHARHCKKLGELRRIESDEQSTEDETLEAAKAIAQVITTCPSGALSFHSDNPVVKAAFQSSGTVQVIEGGEIRIASDIEAEGIELMAHQPSNRIALCRCGLSKNKPFCDASHQKLDDFR